MTTFGRSHVPSLRADCDNCFGLCCVALAFSVSADFAIDKDAGQPCPNLQRDSRCSIHKTLRQQGFAGCTAYDCFGAGQQVSQVTFEGRNWRADSRTAQQMFAVFPVMRSLHESLWYLTEALTLQPARELHADLRRAVDETERLTRLAPHDLLQLDLAPQRAEVGALLHRASELVRATAARRQVDRRGADLAGAPLECADLRGANLRGAYLIAADLRSADLTLADVLGADFRDADLAGADLTTTIFLTQSQLQSAKGDTGTKLPDSRCHPAHWLPARGDRSGKSGRR